MKIRRLDWDGLNAQRMAHSVRGLAPPLSEVSDEVRSIIDRVQAEGDAAIRALGERFGEVVPEKVRVDPALIEASPGLLEPELRAALRKAATNIEAVARAELGNRERPAVAELDQGQRIEVREEPVAAAGVYVPGGRAAYPSSVLMCCLPARVAGVARIAVASPPSGSGRPVAPVLAACALAGVDEVYATGGAQAIAGLALGTESIPRVDVVVGPGNRYVAEAKRQLAGRVGSDTVAGPTELVVVADGTADARGVGLDLCAQAEHGDDSLLVAISPEPALLDRLAELVPELSAERPSVADAPLALVGSPGLEAALSLTDELAPEHLQLVFDGADETTARARMAGCVFVGPAGGTAFGDYAAGSNHVLPTGGAARHSGPLGPGVFRRRTSVVSLPASAGGELAATVAALARAEGFPVHAESAEARR